MPWIVYNLFPFPFCHQKSLSFHERKNRVHWKLQQQKINRILFYETIIFNQWKLIHGMDFIFHTTFDIHVCKQTYILCCICIYVFALFRILTNQKWILFLHPGTKKRSQYCMITKHSEEKLCVCDFFLFIFWPFPWKYVVYMVAFDKAHHRDFKTKGKLMKKKTIELCIVHTQQQQQHERNKKNMAKGNCII